MLTFLPTRGIIAPERAIIMMIVIITALLLHGCAPVYYPNMSHVPLFSDAGEVHASASLTTDGYELVGAVSPVKHIGVAGSYAWGKQNHDQPPPDDHFYREIDLCYYGTTDETGEVRYEVRGGYGNGEARSYETQISFVTSDPTYYLAQSRYDRGFIQGSIGNTFRTPLLKMWGEAGGSIRLARVRFNALRVADGSYDGMMKTFLEPSLFIRAGHPVISGELQMGFASNLGIGEPFDYRTLYFSLGAHLRIGTGEQSVAPAH